jgi:CARDB protein
MSHRARLLTVAATSAALLIGFVGPAGARSGQSGVPELRETGITWIGSADCTYLTIKVEVSNNGTADAGRFKVGLKWQFAGFGDGGHKGDNFRYGLAVGQEKTLVFKIPYHVDQYMDTFVRVDSRNDIAESDETNNETVDTDVYCFS